jgi:hypothetical protein
MTTIKLKNGSGAPAGGDLVQGEPALDLTNKRLYTENASGTVIEVGTNPGVDVTFADNRKAIFGTGSDLQIYHSGSASHITDSGTGNLLIQGTDVRLQNAGATANYLKGTDGAEVSLFYAGGEKLATTSTGIDVTGTATMDGLTVNGVGSVIALSDNAVFNVNVSGGTSKTSTINQRAKSSNGSNAETSIVVTGSSGEAVSAWDFKLDTANGALTKAMTIDGSGDISFYEDTGTTAKLFWDASAESLGIGTSSPAYPLHIWSDTTIARFGGTDTNDTYLNIFKDNASSIIKIQASKAGTGATDVAISPDGGNVGIGTSSPSFPLEVDGGTGDGIKIKAGNTSNDDSFLVANSSNTTMFLVDGGGNVGIGTSSPQASIHTTGDAIIGTTTSGASYEGVLQIADGAVNERTVVLIYNNHPDQFMKLGQDVNTAFIGRDQADEFAIGVFDNAADTTLSKQFVIDDSGNVLIGKTSAGSNNVGAELRPEGYIFGTGDGINPLRLNRKTSDGMIADFQKDGDPVGSIGVVNTNNLRIGGTVADHAGIQFGTNILIPESGGSAVDGGVDLGYASGRFKDLHLSGGVRGTSTIDITIPETSGGAINLEFGNNTNTTRRTVQAYKDNFEPAAVDTGVISLGQAGNKWKDLYLSGNVTHGVTPSSSAAGVFTEAVGRTTYSRGSGVGGFGHLSFINGNGAVGSVVTSGTATAYNTSSDYRLKENVVSLTSATARLNQLAPKRFNFIADANVTVDGFLAHEVADVVPEAITGAKDAMRDEEYEVTPAVLGDDGNVVTEAVMGTRSVPDYQGIDQSKLVPLLVATIQELEARITQLETN